MIPCHNLERLVDVPRREAKIGEEENVFWYDRLTLAGSHGIKKCLIFCGSTRIGGRFQCRRSFF